MNLKIKTYTQKKEISKNSNVIMFKIINHFFKNKLMNKLNALRINIKESEIP